MTLRHLITIMGLLSFLLGGCSKQSAPPSAPSPDAPVLKVAVFADGRLTVDGTAATIQSLQASLRTLSEKHGVVWYYREAGQQEHRRMKRKCIKWAVVGLSVYVATYLVLSFRGAYMPGTIGMQGIKDWVWIPRYFVDESKQEKTRLVQVFLPLYWLDHRFWHNDATGLSGPRKELDDA
jgi:hypothetical protein